MLQLVHDIEGNPMIIGKILGSSESNVTTSLSGTPAVHPSGD
jgi:hypothetical protein